MDSMLNIDVMTVILLLQVKVVRETMNLALDMWKKVKDVSENAPTPVKSACVSAGKFFLLNCFGKC